MNQRGIEVTQTIKLLREDAGRIFDDFGLEIGGDSAVMWTASSVADELEKLNQIGKPGFVLTVNTLGEMGSRHTKNHTVESREVANTVACRNFHLKSEAVQSTPEEIDNGSTPWVVRINLDETVYP